MGEERERWFTVCVGGTPVDGSTDDKAEALAWLKRANHEDAYDGEAHVRVTEEQIAW